jgi:hypothetical protein
MSIEDLDRPPFRSVSVEDNIARRLKRNLISNHQETESENRKFSIHCHLGRQEILNSLYTVNTQVKTFRNPKRNLQGIVANENSIE